MPLALEVQARGLALVRYLYELAIQQSRHTGVRRAIALLTFHDAVEMFLTLALQHHDVYKSNRLYQFKEYWTELATANVHLTQQGTMEMMSRIRANFKHHAVLPAASAIEDARVHVRDFFTENVPIAFSLNLEDVSLASSLTYFHRTREFLEHANKLMAEVKYDEGIGQIAFAFTALIQEYDQLLFDKSEGHSYIPRVSGGMVNASEDVRQLAGNVQRAFDAMHTTVKLVTFGLDFHRYARFRSLTPYVGISGDGQYVRGERHRDTPPTLEDYRFCFDFVIDSALRLQDAVFQE